MNWIGLRQYLVKTCWVSEGEVLEDPEPMLGSQWRSQPTATVPLASMGKTKW